MYTISDLFKQYVVQSDREFDIKATIAGITYLSDAVIDFTIEDTIVSSEELSIGSVITSKLLLSLKTADAVPKNAKITPYVRMNGIGGWTEWVPLSDFYIDERSFQNNTWKFTCYDRLLVSNQDYISTMVFPIGMQQVWDEIMTQLGLTSDISVVIDPTYKIPFAPLDHTMHEMLGFIASAHGASVGISKEGKAKFIKLTSGPATNIDAASYITADRTNDPKVIKKIVAAYNTDGETYIAGVGTDSETLRIFNPFITQAMVNNIFNSLNGFTYTPFTLDWKGRPDVEPGDPILVTLRDTSTIPSVILTNKMSFKGGLIMTSTAPSISENRSETDYKVNLKEYIDRTGLKEDKPYYGVSISRKYGIKITKSDGSSKAVLNSDGLEFTGENHSIMINEWGFNPDFIKRFPNKVINSGFEWYDDVTMVPMYWTGTGLVTTGANWDGTVALALDVGEYIEQGQLTPNTHAGPDPAWWEDLQTRVSFKYKGGPIRASVLHVKDNTAYTVIDNSRDLPVSGQYLEYPSVQNWEAGYVSFYFTPIVGAGKVKIHFESPVGGSTVYIDAVQIEPDFTGMWPSLYSAGPRSLPVADILGIPGGGGIYSGLKANRPGLSQVLKSYNFSAHGLGWRESDQTFWAIANTAAIVYQYSASGALLDSWPVVSSGNGLEIDANDPDILWFTGGYTMLYKYQISTKTKIGEYQLWFDTNGVCAPPGANLWVGFNLNGDHIGEYKKSDGTGTGRSITTSFTPTDLAWDGQYIWVSYANNSLIEAFDPVTLKSVRSFQGPYANHPGMTYAGGHLWVSNTDNSDPDIVAQLTEGSGMLPVIYFATDTNEIYWNVNNVWQLASTSDHGKLLGLTDDDHTQYLNNVRHDVNARHALGTVVPHDDFLGLTDTPAGTYAGHAGHLLAVNVGETGIAFIVPDSGAANATSIQGKPVPIPAALDDQKVMAFDNVTGQMKWVPQGTGSDAAFINGTPVDTISKTDGYVLTYDAATGKLLLKPKPAGGGGGVSGPILFTGRKQAARSIAFTTVLSGFNTAIPSRPATYKVVQISQTKDLRATWDRNSATTVTGYNVYLDGVKHNTSLIPQPAAGTNLVYDIIGGLTIGTTYEVSARAVAGAFDGYESSAKVILGATSLMTSFMTSNTAPAPYVASASTAISGWPPYQAFDGISAGWATSAPSNGTTNNWLEIDFGSALIANRVTIKSRTDGWNDQAPKDFEIQGSNDNVAWTSLDSRVGQVFAINEIKTYDFVNTTAYRYYRLFIIRNNGHTINDAISEMAYYNTL